MKKFLSIIVIASLAFINSASAQSTTQHTCSFAPSHSSCSYRPTPTPTPRPTPRPTPTPTHRPPHGVSEPMGMLVGLAAISAFAIARRRNK